MSTLLDSPGYYGQDLELPLELPVAVFVGRAHDTVPAGYPIRVGWQPCSPGDQVEWAELAVGYQVAGHGDPGPNLAGWVDIKSDLGAGHPFFTSITTTVDIPAGSAVYVMMSTSAKTAPTVGHSASVDALASGRVGIGTDDGSVYRPSTNVGTATFLASSAHPIRVSVLLP